MKGILFNTKMVQAILENRKFETRRPIKPQPTRPYYCGIGHRWDDGHGYEIKPICLVGEVLYVRETFCYDDFDNGGETIYYKADYGERHLKDLFTDRGMKWVPSIHMPKTAARIFLKVTDVRVERLQDITEKQVFKEGIKECHGRATYGDDCSCATIEYINLWDSTIKKQDLIKYSWQANPYVWVYEFKRAG